MKHPPAGITQRLLNHDSSIRLVWSPRICRWLVCQFLPQPRSVTPTLRGAEGVTGSKSRLKFLFSCETEKRLPDDPHRGIPLEPGDWIIDMLERDYPAKQKMIDPNAVWGDAHEKQMIAEEEDANTQYLSVVDTIAKTTAREFELYGGDSQFSVDSSPARKHYATAGPPKKIILPD